MTLKKRNKLKKNTYTKEKKEREMFCTNVSVTTTHNGEIKKALTKI